MKEIRRKINRYSVIDFEAAAQDLERMAANGWMLAEANGNLWKYKRITPQKLHFAITLFPKASALDPEPSEDQQTMWDFCKETGWRLAAQNAQMQIFYNESENPTPLETDPTVQVDKVHSAAKKAFLPAWYILSALGMFQIILIIMRLIDDPIGLLGNSSNSYTASCWILMFILSISEVLNYHMWYRRARKVAYEQDVFLPPNDLRLMQTIILIIAIFLSLCWIISMTSNGLIWAGLVGIAYSCLLFATIKLLSQALKRKKVSAKTNLSFTVICSMVVAYTFIGILTYGIIHGDLGDVFTDNSEAGTYEYKGSTFQYYDHELPLTVEDFRETNYTDYSYRLASENGLLLKQTTAVQHTRLDIPATGYAPNLEYTITEVKLSLLYDKCVGWILAEYDESENDEIPEGFKNIYESIDPSPWEAKAAYQLVNQSSGGMTRYVVCYDDYIVEFVFYGLEPTDKDKSIISEKLASFN